MNQPAHKCDNCKKAFQPTKIDQKYCSARCRQAAYRKRKQAEARRNTKGKERPLSPATCKHCDGAFWARTERAVFCSTSCRTLYHRALKTAIPEALALFYGVPQEKAIDVLETQPVGKIRQLLEDAGFIYVHDMRQWRFAERPT